MQNNETSRLEPYTIDWNLERPIGMPFVYQISEKIFIRTQLYYKRRQYFFDVVFYNNEKQFFLGRFQKEYNDLKVGYNNGRILIYYDKFNHEKKCLEITDVLGLYDILDDMFYSATQEQLLNIFDSSIDSSTLKNKNSLVSRKNRRDQTDETVVRINTQFVLKPNIQIVDNKKSEY